MKGLNSNVLSELLGKGTKYSHLLRGYVIRPWILGHLAKLVDQGCALQMLKNPWMSDTSRRARKDSRACLSA